MSGERKLKAEWVDRIERKHIDWVWRPWLAQGVITFMDGKADVGKSTLLFDVIARVTTGRSFAQFGQAADERPPQSGDATPSRPGPNHPDEPTNGQAGDGAAERGPGKVLLLAFDDPLDSVVAPRLEAAGADLANVCIFRRTEQAGGDGPAPDSALRLPRDLDLITSQCRGLRPRLVVIDSLDGALGADGRPFKVDDETSLCGLLGPLKEVAEEYQTAIVLVRRLDVAAGGSGRRRGSGGLPIPAQARCALLLAADPLDPDGRVLAMVKSNLESAPPSIRFQARGAPIRWLGASDLAADDLARAGDEEKATAAMESAKYFLRKTLFEPRPYTWAQLKELAAQERISEMTLLRARRKLELVKTSRGKNDFIWSLPPKLLNQMHREARLFGRQD